MGLCASRTLTEEEKRNRELEEKLDLDRQRNMLDFKILILGAGESGKSTVVKQLRNIHKGKAAMSEEEVHGYRGVLHTNCIQAMRVLLRACELFHIEFPEATAIDEFEEGTTEFTDETATYITELWGSKEVGQAYEKRHQIYFPDAAPYYFDNVFKFADPEFVPSEEDVGKAFLAIFSVMARIRTTGMFMTQFDVGDVHWRVVDVGGQRSERKKWIRFFDDVEAVLYVVNLAGYNKVLFEDQTKNRMHESLELFQQIANTPVFSETPFFLFLNKKDLFEGMVKKEGCGLEVCFPEFDGGNNVHYCIDFIQNKFLDQMPANKAKDVKCMAIAARVKSDVRAAWDDVKNNLLQRNKKQIDSATKQLKKLAK